MAALYQRARPTTFAEVVGQEHVKDLLSSAVKQGRTSHAYLFSGPRGVGKTTMARLLAMAVNCEAAPELRPCGECESCRLVQSGSHPDVMELDAASHNSVEDVRDLRERVGLASLRGGKRVWILDEAHMLTKSAANALLKTLEEPPAGLVFILATTEPERLPPTILSRCQHYRFRRLTDEQITGKLQRLASEAGVEAEPAALDLVARAADGGMRDAESLLERLLLSGDPITLARAEETLGLPPGEQLQQLARALAADELGELLGAAASLYRQGFAPRTVAEQLARQLRDALHAQLMGGASADGALLDPDALLLALHALDDEQERFVRHNDLYALEVALIKVRNALVGNLPVVSHAAAPAPGASATAAPAAAAAPAAPAKSTPPFEPNRPAARAQTPPATDAPAEAQRAARSSAAPPPAEASAPEPEQGASSSGSRRTFSWHTVRAKAGPQLKAFLMPAAASIEGEVVTLVYQDTHAFHHGQLLTRKGELQALLEQEVGPGVRLVIDGPGGVRTVAEGAGRQGGDAPKV